MNWPGVCLGNLFSRPRATALFLVDGLSADTGMASLSERSFAVDQVEFDVPQVLTDLTGANTIAVQVVG